MNYKNGYNGNGETPLLEGKKVSKYFGGLAAVNNVDFSIYRGEIVGLIVDLMIHHPVYEMN